MPLSRRDFLKTGLAALATPAPRLLLADDIDRKRIEAKADAVIVLWMGGGMAHLETFDPKRYTPFENGMKAVDVCSTFPSKPTVVDGIRFSEGLESIGRVMDRGTLIRSHVAADLGFILHSQAPVPLAHRVRAAGERRGAAPRGLDRACSRARRTRPCPLISTSASATTATARPRNSARSRPAACSAPSSARSASPTPPTPSPPSDPRPG